jgi:hypothetical protein
MLCYNIVTMLVESLATTAWRVLRYRMKGLLPTMEVCLEYIFNKQLQADEKEWSSNFGVGRVANNPSP